ncbi:MAG: OmpA family protein [Marivivens sp.]|nr:OmpA family protein [Marivivens sp.]
MRLSSVFIRVGTFGVAALIATLGAQSAVHLLEDKSKLAVQEALLDADLGWVRVIGDGLQVVLEGEAPDEVFRLRAVNAAGGVVDASRVISNMGVANQTGIEAPDFAIEILRNDSGVSLIGLIPASTDRQNLNGRIATAAKGSTVTDLLEGADYPVPEGWRSAVNFALRALEVLPRSKISVSAGSVTINASADSGDQRRDLEQRIRSLKPDNVALALTITAPRPVVSPYIARFIIDENGARFEACTADTAASRDKILTAAHANGYEGRDSCTLALGVPSRTWGDAVSQSINALGELGGGTLTVSDADVTVTAPVNTDQATFDDVIGRLDNALPELFALTAHLPTTTENGADGPEQFIATLSEDSKLDLSGRVPDDLTNMVIENYARAKFAGDEIVMGTLVDSEGLPAGWQVRVLAGLDALSNLSNGTVTIQSDTILITGQTGDEEASANISGLLVEKFGSDATFSVDVEYVPQLDLVVETPSSEDCVAQINVVTEDRKITFDPGSATLTTDTLPVMDDIAEILSQCVDIELEIAGYTDSQGSEEMNARLSQNRAESVVSALRMRRIITSSFTAKGYGEADPIADNDTEEGREANRRIEFHLVQPEPTEDAAPEPDATETPTDETAPVTEDAPAEPASE